MTLQASVIGCGRIGKRHAQLISDGNVPGLELASVLDTNTARARQFGERYNVPWFASLEDFSASQLPDIAIVCTPSGNHCETSIAMANLGMHVVVEKPMALTLNDADSMILACAENQRKLFVVKQNRFNTPIVRLREALDRGRFGRINLGTVRVRWCRRPDYYEQDSWRGTWAMDGGVLANQASHHVDALEWMLGSVTSVYAIGKTALAPIEVEDTAIALMRFESGALGTIEATTAVRPRDIEGSLSIIGENGIVEIAGPAMNKVRTWEFVDQEASGDTDLDRSSENPPDVYGFGHQRYLAHVVDCVENNTQQLVDGLEGRKSLELISAMYESIATGREVLVNKSYGSSPLGRRN